MRGTLLLVAALTLCACGPKSMQVRRELSEKRAGQLEDALQKAEAAMEALEPAKAEDAFDDARRLSQDPDLPLYPEYLMLTDRLAEDEKRLPAVRKAREKRDLDEAVVKQRQALEEPTARWKKAVVAIEPRAVTVDQAEEARDAEEALRKQLAEGASLVERDPGYTALAKDLRTQLERTGPAVTLSLARARFIETAGAQKTKAFASLKRGWDSKNPEEKRDAGGDALSALESCSKKGTEQVTENATLAKAAIAVDGVNTTPESVVAWCASQVKEAEKLKNAAPPKSKPAAAKPAPKKAAKKK